MKRFYLVRHAKSSWADPSLMDIERPLNDRGKRDAPFMAQKLKDLDSEIEVFVSSPAKRAKKTAQVFSSEFFGTKKIILEDDLYHASAHDILDVIKEFDDSYNAVAVFGHNPGFTYLANYFAADYIDNVPTCGIVCIELNHKSWSEIEEDNCKLTHFIYPKMYIA